MSNSSPSVDKTYEITLSNMKLFRNLMKTSFPKTKPSEDDCKKFIQEFFYAYTEKNREKNPKAVKGKGKMKLFFAILWEKRENTELTGKKNFDKYYGYFTKFINETLDSKNYLSFIKNLMVNSLTIWKVEIDNEYDDWEKEYDDIDSAPSTPTKTPTSTPISTPSNIFSVELERLNKSPEIEVYLPKKKIALCIGNQDYESEKHKISSCRSDATAIHEILKSEEFGFSSELLLDAKKNEIQYKIEELIEEIEDEDMFFFYYSGHGSESNRKSMIFGTDSDIHNGIGISVQSELIKKIMDSKKSIALIVVLDACRIDPEVYKYQSKGVDSTSKSEITIEEENSIEKSGDVIKYLIYSSDPGTKSHTAGTNSVFTKVFKEYLKDKQRTIEDILKLTSRDLKNGKVIQKPWTEISSSYNIMLSASNDNFINLQ
eukprot:gene2981-4991_t